MKLHVVHKEIDGAHLVTVYHGWHWSRIIIFALTLITIGAGLWRLL